MTGRRDDGETRGRIDKLVEEWHAAVDRLDRRYRRVAILVIVCVAVGIGAGVLGYMAIVADRHREDRDRYRAVYSACLARNDTADGVKDFLVKLNPDENPSQRVLDLADESFHSVPDCRKYAVALLGRPAPGGAFDLPRGADPRALPSATPGATPTP